MDGDADIEPCVQTFVQTCACADICTEMSTGKCADMCYHIIESEGGNEKVYNDYITIMYNKIL